MKKTIKLHNKIEKQIKLKLITPKYDPTAINISLKFTDYFKSIIIQFNSNFK